MSEPGGGLIRVTELDCWHADEVIYQADGRTSDGQYVFVRYRRPWFSVGVGPTLDTAFGADTFFTDAHPDHDPGSIDRATLAAWTAGVVEWPDRVTGFNDAP